MTVLISLVFFACPLLAIWLINSIFEYSNNNKKIKILSLLILLPAFFSLLFMANITINKNGIIHQTYQLPAIKIYFGILLNNYITFYVLSILIGIILTIFFSNQPHMSALCGLVNFLMIISPDYFLLISAYSVGNLILISSILSNETETIGIWNITSNFLWQRISDLMSFIALLIIYINFGTLLETKLSLIELNHLEWSRTLLFTSIILRMISITSLHRDQADSQLNSLNNALANTVMVITGCLIMFYRLSSIIFVDDSLSNVFRVIILLIVLHAFFSLIFTRNKETIKTNLIYLLATLAITAISWSQNILSLILICIVSAFFPLLSPLVNNIQNYRKTKIAIKKAKKWSLSSFFFKVPMRSSYFIAEFFSHVVGTFYTNIVFYRAPQIVFGLIQLPLRLFHNGNLQRSILLSLILMASYYSFWRQ